MESRAESELIKPLFQFKFVLHFVLINTDGETSTG